MVWLVVTFNAVFYLGKSMKFEREYDSSLRGRTRWAVIKNCTMFMNHPTRPRVMKYSVAKIRGKYVLWYGEVKIDVEKATYEKMMKLAKKLKLTERFK